MSTIDPAIARKRRQERRPSIAAVIIVLVLLLGGGFALGLGWGGLGSIGESADPPLLTILAISIGMPVTIACSIIWAGISMKRRNFGMGSGTAATFLGGGAGVLTAARNVDDPLVLNVIGYGILALGVLFVVLGLTATAARRRQEKLTEELMRTGRLTTATVTDKGYVIFSQSTKILSTVTFTFFDLHSVQRWVQRPLLIRAEDPVVDGMETRLWYDPTEPGNDHRIVVELALTHRFANPLPTTN